LKDQYLWQGCRFHQSSIQLETEARSKADCPENPQRICAQHAAACVVHDQVLYMPATVPSINGHFKLNRQIIMI
jgi:hypothetical protein